nr:phosphotransferase [Methylomarinum sp. Ch1-1]MDP4522450.1 phosphotransferase [Methylomarinum sp. Ch1-1]
MLKLNDKSAALFSCLPGQSLVKPTPNHCYEIGRQLALLHIYAGQFEFRRRNPKNLSACQTLFDDCKALLSDQEIQTIVAELAFQRGYEEVELPNGVIHADLFRDNVLFEHGRVSGILDFYACCNDFLLLDIAIAINDWCRRQSVINKQKMTGLLQGYQSIRPLESLERQLLPVFLRRAALRFWLSRLKHRTDGKNGDLTQHKDPAEFRLLLEQHRSQPTLSASSVSPMPWPAAL